MEKVELARLRMDEKLYPRTQVSPANLQSLRDALDMKAKLPPLIAWKDDGAVIDGFHRLTVYRERGVEWVEVEWREYASKADAFADAVALNAGHGLRLSRDDHAHIVERARQLNLEPKRIPVLLKVPVDRIEKPRAKGNWHAPGPQALPGGLDEQAAGYAPAVVAAVKHMLRYVAPDSPKPQFDLHTYLMHTAALQQRRALDPLQLIRLAAACIHFAVASPDAEAAA